MALPKTIRGTRLSILMGNGAAPEVFTAYCGLTAKTFRFQSQNNDIYVPDCANPDASAWREVVRTGKSMQVTGSGLLDMAALAAYQAAFANDVGFNAQMSLANTLAEGGGYWQGPFVLSQLELTGNLGQLATVNLTYESTGIVGYTAAVT